MSKGKHKKQPKGKIRRMIQIICIITFIAGIIYLAYYLYTTNQDKQEDQEIKSILANIKIDTTKITQEKTERVLQLEELQKQNSEIIGWIEIAGSNISYPVCQANDNSFYLDHNYKKDKARVGTLFLDKNFNLSKPSTNYLIYGHRNKQSLMLEDLIKYSKEEFYREHPTIRFTTSVEDAEYEIIAVFYSRAYYKDEQNVFRYYNFIEAETEAEYNSYIESCKSVSIYDTGKTASYGEQLLTLSTCEYSQENGRFVVVARKSK